MCKFPRLSVHIYSVHCPDEFTHVVVHCPESIASLIAVTHAISLRMIWTEIQYEESLCSKSNIFVKNRHSTSEHNR